jgi:hypothetical protein
MDEDSFWGGAKSHHLSHYCNYFQINSKQNHVKMQNPHLHSVTLKSPSPFKKSFYLAKIKNVPMFNSLDKHHPIYMHIPNKMATSLKPVYWLV